MNRARNTGHLMALSGLAAATMWIALAAWSPFVTVPGEFLGPLALIAATIAVTGGLLRAFGVPTLLTLLAQVAVFSSGLCRAVAGSYVPDSENLAAVGAALDASLEAARNYAAPIGAEAPPVAPLLILGGGLLVLVMDLLACGLRRVPLAGLALLAAYAVPAGVPTEGSAWFSFLAASVGFLALLHLDAGDRMQRWGHGVGPNDSNEWSRANPIGEALRAGAGRIGLVAIAAALVTPVVVPVLDLGLIGRGSGGGGDDITIREPVADMRRDLERPDDRPLLTVTTDDPRPEYLRIAVLNRFTGLEWTSGDRDVNSSNRADGALPAPQGVGPDVPQQTYEYDVEVTDDFESTWLPTQFPAASVVADGDWRFDTDSMDFIASDSQTTRGLDYTMTAIDHDFGEGGALFADATAGDVDPEFLELPRGTPTLVQDLADSVTESATSDYQRAALLQQWFRSEFVYSLERAPRGTGNNTLEGFLNENGRVGYCEQFASAMAVMARELGIPARVAVGFLRPSRTDATTWTYSSHDLHAWPELYFSGTGWVRFEPTPAGRAIDVPAYSSLPEGGGEDDVGGGPTQQPTGAADDQGIQPTAAPTAPGPSGEAVDAAADDGWGTTPWVVLGIALLCLALLGLLGPRWVRRRVRERRLAGDAEAGWDEVWASTIDLGLPWPDQRSPREVGAALTPHLADDDAVEALDRLVLAVERARYARPGHDAGAPDGWTEEVTACTAALARGVTARARRRAAWMPRSLTRRAPQQVFLSEREPVPLGG